MKVLVIIPAYNEEESIASVIQSIDNETCQRMQSMNCTLDVVVIDDGSHDRTAFVARDAGARVISLPFNLGIGGAMQTGYRFAKEEGYDVAIQVDGDGQHDPSYIYDMLKKMQSTSSNMIIGSRYVEQTSYKSTITRRTGMVFFSGLVSLLTGMKVRVTDTTSGFRAVNRDVIEYFAENYPTDYPEVDVLVRLHKKRFTIAEMPVEMRQRQGGSSSITPVRSIYYMIKVSLSLLFNAIRSSNMA